MLKDIAQGDGDLTKRLAVEQRDEVGELCRYFNQFAENIQHIIQDIASATHQLSASAKELPQVSMQTNKGVREQEVALVEINSANEELRTRIAEQKLVMEDVMDLVNSYEQSPGLAQVIQTLQPVVTAFDAVTREEASSDISKSGGAIVIGGGPRYTASEEVLAQITEAVSTARNQLVK